MNRTTIPLAARSTTVRALGIAVAAVAAAGLFLGLLAASLGQSAPTASGAVAAPPAAPASPGLEASPAPAPGTAVAPDENAAAPAVTSRHVVTGGETLAGLAERYGVPFELLAADNGLADPDRVDRGAVLEVSVPPSNVVVIADGATLGGYAQQLATTVERLQELNPQIDDPDRIVAGAGLRVAMG